MFEKRVRMTVANRKNKWLMKEPWSAGWLRRRWDTWGPEPGSRRYEGPGDPCSPEPQAAIQPSRSKPKKEKEILNRKWAATTGRRPNRERDVLVSKDNLQLLPASTIRDRPQLVILTTHEQWKWLGKIPFGKSVKKGKKSHLKTPDSETILLISSMISGLTVTIPPVEKTRRNEPPGNHFHWAKSPPPNSNS